MNDLGEIWIFFQNLVGTIPLIPIVPASLYWARTDGTHAAPPAYGATPVNVGIFIYNSLPHCTVFGAGREKL